MLTLVYDPLLLSYEVKILYLTGSQTKNLICREVLVCIVVLSGIHCDASAFILLPQLLLEGGMPYNLTCGISGRNDTFLKKGFIICFLRACTCRIAFPLVPSFFFNIYNYISPWLRFSPFSLDHKP